MDTRNGAIKAMDEIKAIEREHFVPIRRSLTEREQYEKRIEPYSPCGCGSGKKFKFCCKRGAKP